MGEIEWAMWANEQALISSFLILIGGIIGVVSSFKYWEAAAVSIALSVLVLIIEYPRGRRAKGTTMERSFQEYLSPLVSCMSPVTANYYVRGFALMLIGVPGCFLLPTIIGGLCLMLAGLIYIVAAIKGESWKPVVKRGTSGNTPKTIIALEPPPRPAPRLKISEQLASPYQPMPEQPRY